MGFVRGTRLAWLQATMTVCARRIQAVLLCHTEWKKILVAEEFVARASVGSYGLNPIILHRILRLIQSDILVTARAIGPRG